MKRIICWIMGQINYDVWAGDGIYNICQRCGIRL